jgi:hypothetical protein
LKESDDDGSLEVLVEKKNERIVSKKNNEKKERVLQYLNIVEVMSRPRFGLAIPYKPAEIPNSTQLPVSC